MEFSKLVNLANAAVKTNKIQEAIKLFDDALKLNPTSFDVCSKLGSLAFQIGDLDKSINYFKKTLLLDPKSSLGYSNLGLIYSRLNNKDLALQNYLKAYKIEPKNFIVNYNLANYFFYNNDDKNAEKYYLLSIKLQPDHFYPYNNLFQLYDRSNNLEKLEEIFINILKLFGRTPQVLFLEGSLKFKKKKYRETIKIFKHLYIDKKDFQKSVLITNILAKCYDYIGSYSEAYEYYSKSNKITENSIKNKFDKNKYNERVTTRLNFFTNFENKPLPVNETFDEHIDPVFLIGFPRSGTTLLDTILRTHKSIEVIEEKLLVENLIDKLRNYIDNNFSNLKLINKDKIKLLRDFYFKKRNNFVEHKNNTIIVDKLPLNIIYTAELNKIFPRAKFIFALRNPYDAVLSCFMQPFLPNDAMSNFYNLKDSSNFYDQVMSLWEIYQKSLNLNLHTIKYEDLVNNFDNTVKKLLIFLGVEWSDKLRNFHLTASKRGMINTPSINQVNMPLYNKSILRWKNYSDKFSNNNFILEKWIKKFDYN